MNYQTQIFSSTNLGVLATNVNNFYNTNRGITVISAEMDVVRNSNTVRVYTFTITYKKP